MIEAPIAVPIDLDREQAVEQVLRRFVDRLESYARRYPSLYLNWHLLGPASSPAGPPA